MAPIPTGMDQVRLRAVAAGAVARICAALSISAPVLAQDVPAEQRVAQGMLEEITVTARKREESLQDTPISIAAFSAERLEAQGVSQITRIQDFTPNLVFQNTPANSGVGSNAAVFIRGIGQKDFAPTTEPGVGIYIDGAYLGRSVGGVFDLMDVERVEVLRGPQGTLFGRNTIGGAISITSKKPQNDFSAKADVKVGTDNRLNVRSTVNVPLTDSFYAKVTAASLQQDGYVKRPFDGKDLGDQDYKYGRMALRWLASDSLELNLAADFSRDKSNGPPVVITGFVRQPTFGPDANFITLNNAFALFDPATGPGNPELCFAPQNANNAACYNERIVAGRETNLGTGPQFSDLETTSATLTAEWDVGPLTLKSITSYREVDGSFAQDRDGAPQTDGAPLMNPINHVFDTFQQDQFTQELQLQGKGFDDRLDWLLGLYYFTEDGENLNPVDFRPVSLQSGGYFDYESRAVFAQATYRATDKLSITPGVRYTEDDRNYLPDQYFEELPVGPLAFPCFDPSFHIPCAVGDRVVPYQTVKSSAEEFTPYFNIAYQWTADVMTYASYSEGFKSGGYTQRIFPPEASLPSFAPEYVKSYEVGFKLAPGPNMHLNGAVFYTDYTDLQLLVADATRIGPFITNAGSAEIRGFELEWAYAFGEGWRLDAGAGYTDPEYKELRNDVQGLTVDSDFVLISEWNASASVERRIALASAGDITPRLDWSWRSKFQTNASGVPDPRLVQPDYSVLNASVSWRSASEHLAVTAGVDNATDERYRTFGDFQPGFGFYMEAFDRGRQWYIKLMAQY